MKQLQQLLHHVIPKFHYFKVIVNVSACKMLQNFFEEMTEFQNSIQD